MEEAVPGGGAGAVIVTDACADFVLSATLVAVTVKFPAVVPATYSPVEEIVPPVALQVTAVLVEPATLAENCCDAPSSGEADVGLMVTLTEEGGPLEEFVEPPHPERLESKTSGAMKARVGRKNLAARVPSRRPEAVETTELRRGIVWDSPEQANGRQAGVKLYQRTDLAQGQAVFYQRRIAVSVCQRQEGSARYAWWSRTSGMGKA
jgi:hypothetical protein